jgi:hypothetical protein
MGMKMPPSNQHEATMSADKDRGIRRQKQKRAKDIKKQSRQQRPPAEAQPGSAKKTPQQKAA